MILRLSTISLLCVMIFSWTLSSAASPEKIIFRLKEKIPMMSLVKKVLDPHSDRYRHGYSSEEIRDLVGPSDHDFAALMKDLKDRGIKVLHVDKTRLYVTAMAPSANFFLSAKSGALVHSVIRSDSTFQLQPLHEVSGPTAAAPLTPDQIKNIYGFNSIYAAGFTGKGQDVAVATYDNFNIQDIQAYYGKINLPVQPTVDQVAVNGALSSNPESAFETEADAELLGMIAPAANIHIFSSSHNDEAGEVELFNAILDDGRSQVISYSWGTCEANVSSTHESDMDGIFGRAMAQAVNIVAASGNSGAMGCGGNTPAGFWPAVDSQVLAVGGTSLTASGAETAWSGSGGGISSIYGRPVWQENINAAYTMRGIPDVAFNADPNTGENVWVAAGGSSTAQWVQTGGTGIAAPQWAGFLTLVNEARGQNGPLWTADPIIYALSASDLSADFNDITSGNNGKYSAGPGWDAVTGWGSMKADKLFGQLVSNVPSMPASDDAH